MPKFQAFRNANEEKIQEVWNDFLKQYPNEESVIENLFAEGGLFCYHCGHQLAEPSKTPRVYLCPGCQKRVWPTSRTFLKKKKKPRAWLAGIFFIEHSVSIGAPRFAKLLDIAPSSATTLLRTLRMVMNDYLSTNCTRVYSGLFLSIFTRRSKETPRKLPPDAEQDAYEGELEEQAPDTWEPAEDVTPTHSNSQDETPESLTISSIPESLNSNMNNDKQTELEAAVNAALSIIPQHLDRLCQKTGIAPGQLMAILTLLELKGLIKHLEGNLFTITHTGKLPQIDIPDNHRRANDTGLPLHILHLIKEFQLFVRQIFHGISRRYLQLYLAEYWTKLTDHWKNGALLKVCLNRGKLMQAKETSPTHLRVMLPQPDQAFLAQPAL